MPSVAHQVEAPPSSGLRLERARTELFLESGYDAVTDRADRPCRRVVQPNVLPALPEARRIC